MFRYKFKWQPEDGMSVRYVNNFDNRGHEFSGDINMLDSIVNY